MHNFVSCIFALFCAASFASQIFPCKQVVLMANMMMVRRIFAEDGDADEYDNDYYGGELS